MRYRTLSLIALGSFFLSIYALRICVSYLAKDLGASDVEIARILYTSFLCIPFLAPLAGYLCDILGTRIVIAVSAVGSTIVTILYSLSSSWIDILLLRAIHTVFTELCIAVSLAVASYIVKVQGRGFGLLRASQGISIALGPYLGAVLMTSLGYVKSFLVISMLSLLPLVAISMDIKPQKKLALFNAIKLSSRYASNRYVMSLLFIAIAEVICFVTIASFFSAYIIKDLGYEPELYGLFLAIESTGFSLGSLLADYIYLRRGYAAPLIASTLCISMLTLIAVYSEPLYVIAAGFFIGIASGLMLNPLYIEISRSIEDHARGTAINVIDALITLSGGISPIVLDVATYFIGIRWIPVATAIMIAGLVFIATIIRRT